MILNIEILMNIRALITRYNFMIDDLSVRCELEDTPLDEMIAKGDEDIVDLLNVINDIDKLIGALTEDLRESMQNEGFDWLDYCNWNLRLTHNPLSLVGLIETFTEALKQLDFYIIETMRGYKILTQPAYNQKVFETLAEGNVLGRGTE